MSENVKRVEIFAILFVLMAASGIAVSADSASDASNLSYANTTGNALNTNVSLSSSSNTIYVHDDYPTIQDAVNAASPGDTIIVRDGTYIENIKVNKSLTIRSENGSDSTIVRAATSEDHVFNVTADYVNISGFTVKGATGWRNAGIYLYHADYCNISGNKCSNKRYYVIHFRDSKNNSISNNNCSNNRLASTSIIQKTTATKNITVIIPGIKDVPINNISIFPINNISFHNNISNDIPSNMSCRCLSPPMPGDICLRYSNNNSISNNNCSNNWYDGINLYGSNNNSISSNNCSSNRGDGILLYHSNNNKLTGNVMVENGIGIEGDSMSNYTHEIDESNTVNGKPVYYWKDVEGGIIPDGAGQVIIVNCINVIVENQELNKASVGIEVAFSSNITIKNNNCSNNDDGIRLWCSKNNIISNNKCSSNSHNGIYLRGSNNWCGIYFDDSKNNSISNNNCSNNWYGIHFYDSNNNILSNNNCSNNRYGIYLSWSDNNKLTGNVMVENGICIEGDSLSDYTHEIDESNTVNGKPVCYWRDVEGGRIPDGAGQVIIVKCKNVLVENQELNAASVGIEVAFSSNIIIKNNNCSNNWHGICLRYSTNNSISNNNCSSNNRDGIYLSDSNSNSISNNSCSNNGDGISLGYSTNNSISNNNCSNNRYGIHLDDSNNNKLTGNSMVENGIVIDGYWLSQYMHEIDESNTVNGKPIYYWKDVEGGKIPDGAGQVILANCSNVIVKNQNLSNASIGIRVAFSSFITIKNNNCSNNWDGISIRDSNNNSIYLNNFIDNTDNIYSFGSTNTWNSTEEITYTYKEKTNTSYLGNYWDDYRGTDADKDGIGDWTSYIINSDKDFYPLIEPYENYHISTFSGGKAK